MSTPTSIVILRHSMTSLRQAETYFKNRKWTVQSTMDLKEILTLLTQVQPQFVLVSVQHPNPKVKLLAKLLPQAFGTHVLPYADDSTPAITRTLNEASAEYAVFPPVSGLSIERTIDRVLNRVAEIKMGDIELKPSDRSLYIPPSNDEVISFKGQQEAKEAIQRLLGAELDSPPKESANKKSEGSKAKAAFPFSPAALAMGVSNAVDKSLIRTEKENPEIVSETKNISCLQVRSKRISGYLIAALGKNKKVDTPFLERVQKHLYDYLHNLGETLQTAAPLEFDFTATQFPDWIKKDADFLKTSFHQGDEIKIAFFERKDMDGAMETSSDDKMFRLPLTEIATDTRIFSNTYIYLALNKRHVLYLPQGNIFYKAQKDRLIEKGFTELHFEKKNLDQYKEYRAKTFFEEKYQLFINKNI